MDSARFDIPVGFDVAFDQVGAVIGQPATSLLIEATDYVSRLIESFQGEFPRMTMLITPQRPVVQRYG